MRNRRINNRWKTKREEEKVGGRRIGIERYRCKYEKEVEVRGGKGDEK